MTDQLNLLSTDLASELEAAYGDWERAQTRALSASSRCTYGYIWQSFAQFLVQLDRPLQAVSVGDLTLFLDGLSPRDPYGDEINDRYAWRALTLIKRVTTLNAKKRDEPANLAAQELLNTERFRYVNARGHEPLPQALEPAVARELIRKLVGDAVALGLKPHWKTERDRACLALMLGSGLTPLELRQLRVSDVSIRGSGANLVPWKLHVLATAKTVAHDAPIAGWARRCLTRWLKVRVAEGFNGDVLFPGTASGKTWTDVGCQAAQTKALVDLLGDSTRYGGLMRLRHTFVIRQLRKSTGLDQIANWMGIRDLERMQRYRRVITSDTQVE